MQNPIFFFWQFSLVWIICAAMMTIVCVCTMCTHSLSLSLTFRLFRGGGALRSGRFLQSPHDVLIIQYYIHNNIMYCALSRPRLFFRSSPWSRRAFGLPYLLQTLALFSPPSPAPQHLSSICLSGLDAYFYSSSPA